MRFLQTEWHRHERDRNAWEIEKQEMKSRIANLEGQARRADATQKALKKYVTILEKKVKDQATLLKSGKTPETEPKLDRAALLQEKLRREFSLVHFSARQASAASDYRDCSVKHRKTDWTLRMQHHQRSLPAPQPSLARLRLVLLTKRPHATN